MSEHLSVSVINPAFRLDRWRLVFEAVPCIDSNEGLIAVPAVVWTDPPDPPRMSRPTVTTP